MTPTETAPIGAPERSPFRDGEPVWSAYPAGPRYGQDQWDISSLVTRVNASERFIRLDRIKEGYRELSRASLMVLAQPDHPGIIRAGVVRRGHAASVSSVLDQCTRLSIISHWGVKTGLADFAHWTQSTCDDLLTALREGSHRVEGSSVSPYGIMWYVIALRRIRDCHALLDGGLGFRPWGSTGLKEVAAAPARRHENETAPLPWDVWSAAVAAAWRVVVEWSPDILRAARARDALPPRTRGDLGPVAQARIEEWDRKSGVVPLHSGFGRYPGVRGTVNFTLLARQLEIDASVLNGGGRRYVNARAVVARAAEDPRRTSMGGLVVPSAVVDIPGLGKVPWISELGLGECEFFVSVLRAACYIIIACLTGMRDGEIQELEHTSRTVKDTHAALRAIQHKGTRKPSGEVRTWWAPTPVLTALEVLSDLSPHPTHVFARSATNAGAYDPQRDIPRLIEFVNGDPATRPGRGSGLGLEPIGTHGGSLNATSLRRSFAVYATTHAGAELGLGIQLGHAAWRMSTGYMSDGQEIAVGHLSRQRKDLMRAQARELIVGDSPVAGGAAAQVEGFRAQVIGDGTQAERLVAQVASRLFPGLTNDCMWNPATSGCGADGPHLTDHACVGERCANALVTDRHAGIFRDSIERVDNALDALPTRSPFRAQMQRNRAGLAKTLRRLEGREE